MSVTSVKKFTTHRTQRTQFVQKIRLICIKEGRGGSKFYLKNPIKNQCVIVTIPGLIPEDTLRMYSERIMNYYPGSRYSPSCAAG